MEPLTGMKDRYRIQVPGQRAAYLGIVLLQRVPHVYGPRPAGVLEANPILRVRVSPPVGAATGVDVPVASDLYVGGLAIDRLPVVFPAVELA